jgi:hypothetical protein
MTKPIIPDAALKQHLIALGKTGAGKSSVLRLLVERMLDDRCPVCILDPKGDWWGLKSSARGDRAGYPVVIFGGEHGDVPLNAHAGAHVAELVATGNRPCIIDLGGWLVSDRTRFFIDFASTLFRHSRGPRWLVIDEVHNFAPQGKVLDPDAGKMLHWANRLASEGRGKGITLLAASQRPQKVHKDFVTSCETLIAMRVIHPLDRGAIKDWIDGCPDASKGREVLEQLASMPRGEGWVWSPEIGFGPVRIAFPLFKTYDSFAAPTGEGTEKLKGWAEVDLDDVKSKLATVVQEAEANDPKRLRAEISRLNAQAHRLTKDQPGGATPAQLNAEYTRGREEGFDAGRQEAARILREIATEAKSKIHVALGQLNIAAGHVDSLAEVSERTYAKRKSIDIHLTHKRRQDLDSAVPHKAQQRASAGQAAASPELGTGGLRRMMIALAQRPQGLTRRSLGVRAGMSSQSGTFATYLAKGRTLGWLNGDANAIRVTDAGLEALGSYEPLPTGSALRAYWIGEFGGGAARLLEAIAAAYPDGITRDQAGDAAQLSPQSGTFATYLSKLRALELISGSGTLRASDELFD